MLTSILIPGNSENRADVFIFLTIAILALINISMIIHSRKVDGAQSPADFTGYTRNSNVRAIIFGACYAVLICVLILSLV